MLAVPAAAGATLPDRVFSELKEAIVHGRIPPGGKISEPELARRYGVSRGPLREAIGRLEACGLVVRRPNLGARVVELSHGQLLEIYQVREALEGLAARLAAEQMSDEEIAELRALLDQHDREIEQDPKNAYFQKEGDLDFHYCIVQGSGNSRLVELLCNDLYQLVRYYRYRYGTASNRGPSALAEHGHIVDAIERRDGELAELLMRAHVRISRENVQRLLAERELEKRT